MNPATDNRSVTGNALSEETGAITIRRPDDFHLHLRDGAMMRAVLPYTANTFARAVIMPNLVPPVTTPEAAAAYRRRILDELPEGSDFLPLMTCFLTDDTVPEQLACGFAENIWVAAKLFPAGATTNSHNGVRDIPGLDPVLERMEKIGMPLLVHGETTDPEVDIFDRENVFMETVMLPLLQRHQGLKAVIEHVTTEETVSIVREYAPRVAGTITPHHLLINRTSIFQGGLQPYNYCLPVAKREHHRQALRRAATSGDACFFLGTDSAPHPRSAKEAAHASAGLFVGGTALQCYARVFEEEGALGKLEAFASEYGARFYGLPLNRGRITLYRHVNKLPEYIHVPGGEDVRVFQGGEDLAWSLEQDPFTPRASAT